MKIHLGPYRKNRKVLVQIDDHDVWNLDHTLSMIILECLKKMRNADLNGFPGEFAQPNIREDGINYGGEGGELDAWLETLDKMIEGFEILAAEDWPTHDMKDVEKAQHALYLFAHYYMSLWD